MNDRMKLNIVYLAIAGVAMALLMAMSSCSNQNIVSDKKITCTPDSFMLLPDSGNQAALNLQVHIPKHYFAKRSRLFVIPVLTDSDSIVAKYKPIVLDAPIYRKKMERKWVLDSIADPYDSIAQRVTNTKVDLSVLYNDTSPCLQTSIREASWQWLLPTDAANAVPSAIPRWPMCSVRKSRSNCTSTG